MCGITGFITAGNYYTSVEMERFLTFMTNAVVHRGLDHGGPWSDTHAGVIPIHKKWTEHLSGLQNRQYKLWDVLIFQAWLEANK